MSTKIKMVLPLAALAVSGVMSGLAYAPAAHADTVCQTSPFKVVALNDQTSCPFAIAVANMRSTDGYVTSPVTGETYYMHCMIESHGSTTCRGGNDAAVQIF